MTLSARIDELARAATDAQKRLRMAQESEHAIRAERDRIIRALAEAGRSQRSIGALIGITAASVKAILDQRPGRPLPLAVLRRAGLYPVRGATASNWLTHWLASNQPRKPWIDISATGNQTLTRTPNPVT
ncbi:MAG TPA: hypothetical protein VKV80_01620 [Streptosporangiaceae bacterium]|nr:hypothetical protein [Streptosporangiaceae bacterium]